LAKIQHFVFPVFDFGGASPCCLKIFRCLGFWRVWFSFCANFVLAAPDFFSTGFCVGHQISFCPVHLLAFPGFWRWFRSAQGAAYFPILLACDFLPSPIPCRSAARPLLAVLWSVSSLDFLAGPVLARDSFSAFSCRLDLSLRSRSQGPLSFLLPACPVFGPVAQFSHPLQSALGVRSASKVRRRVLCRSDLVSASKRCLLLLLAVSSDFLLVVFVA
jgi:hypothetical protein